jgi:hypothetical protein
VDLAQSEGEGKSVVNVRFRKELSSTQVCVSYRYFAVLAWAICEAYY